MGYKGGTIYQLFGYLEIFDKFYKNSLWVHFLSAFKKDKILKFYINFFGKLGEGSPTEVWHFKGLYGGPPPTKVKNFFNAYLHHLEPKQK